MAIVIWAVNLLMQLLTLVVIVKVFLAYFMAPYHPVRLIIDRIVEPFLRPIRKIIPSVGMLDISPIILIVAVQLLRRIFVNLLLSIG